MLVPEVEDLFFKALEEEYTTKEEVTQLKQLVAEGDLD